MFHQEYFISNKKELAKDSNVHIKCVDKFIINMNPRVLLVPSISTESGPVIDYTLIKSPAQNILVIIISRATKLNYYLFELMIYKFCSVQATSF